MSRLGFEHQVASERAHALLYTARTQAELLQFLKCVLAAEAKTPAVVADADDQVAVILLQLEQDVGGLGVLMNVVKGLADDLQYVDADLAGGAHGFLPAHECYRDAALLLEVIDQPPRRRGEAGGIHLDRT